MKPLKTLDSTTTPDGQELVLQHREADFFIYIDGEELMSTRAAGSEIALAELGCESLESDTPRILIGGLGLGYTLRACLDILPRHAEVVVAELMPEVVGWARTHLRELHGKSLDDRRVRIVEKDVWDVLGRAGGDPAGSGFDAILLDVDNGPESWCIESNGRLYTRDGIEHIRKAMAPGGRIAIWSSQPDPRFANRLRKRGFETRTHTIRTQGLGGNRRHVVITARASKHSRLRKRPIAKGRLK